MNDHPPASLSRPVSRQLLPPVVHKLAPPPMSLDVAQPGGSVASAPVADGNGDGDVNQLDYDVWKTNVGSMLPVGGGGSSATSVAEPVALGRGQAQSGV